MEGEGIRTATVKMELDESMFYNDRIPPSLKAGYLFKTIKGYYTPRIAKTDAKATKKERSDGMNNSLYPFNPFFLMWWSN